MTIPTHLIENALNLTGKTMDDMDKIYTTNVFGTDINYKFSIEKFCYYLLSPEFIDKYNEINPTEWGEHNSCLFGLEIYQYQSGDSEGLICLLEKI